MKTKLHPSDPHPFRMSLCTLACICALIFFASTALAKDGVAASGQDGDLSWTIDYYGKLSITGSGDFYGWDIWGEEYDQCYYSGTNHVPSWCLTEKTVTSAEVCVDGIHNLNYFFYGLDALESIDLSGLDSSQVTTMHGMFSGCLSLDIVDLALLDSSSATDISYLLQDCELIESVDLSSWNLSCVENISGLFYGCSSLTDVNLDSLKEAGNLQNISEMFAGCSSLTSLDLNLLDVSQVEDMSGLFRECSSLASVEISAWDTSSAVYLSHMFEGCPLREMDLRFMDWSNVTTCWGMFSGCWELESLQLPEAVSEELTHTPYMFYGCQSLASLDFTVAAPKLEDTDYMFADCDSLTSLDLSSLDGSYVKTMYGMFKDCTALTSLNLDGWDLSACYDCREMLSGCRNLQQISPLVLGPDYADQMFYDCQNLTADVTFYRKPSSYKKCFREAATSEGALITLHAAGKCSDSGLVSLAEAKSDSSQVVVGDAGCVGMFRKMTNVSAGIKLSWYDMAGAESAVIEKSTDDGLTWQVIAEIAGEEPQTENSSLQASSYIDADVKNGGIYIYRIVPYAGESECTSIEENTAYLTAVTIKPGSFRNEEDGVYFTWSGNKKAENAVVYAKNSDGSYEALEWTGTSYLDMRGHKNGAKYTYKVACAIELPDKRSLDGIKVVAGVLSDACSYYYLTAPEISSVKKVSSGSGSAAYAVTWKKNKKATGYQIQYSTSKKFTDAKSIWKKDQSKTLTKIRKTSGSKCYVRVRAYKKTSDRKHYSAWSQVKKI